MSRREFVGESQEAGDQSPVAKQNAILAAIDAALETQAPVAAAFAERLRSKDPDASPQDILKKLEKRFLAMTTATGPTVGAGGIASGIGSGIGVAPLGETAASLGAAVLYILAVAEVHQIEIRDIERKRTLVLAILLGRNADKIMGTVAGTAPWTRAVVNSVPLSTIRQINTVLGAHFVTRYGTRQGVIVLSRVIPFGLGAAIGGGVNFAVRQAIVKSTRAAFGPLESSSPAPAVTAQPAPPALKLIMTLAFCLAAGTAFWLFSVLT